MLKRKRNGISIKFFVAIFFMMMGKLLILLSTDWQFKFDYDCFFFYRNVKLLITLKCTWTQVPRSTRCKAFT